MTERQQEKRVAKAFRPTNENAVDVLSGALAKEHAEYARQGGSPGDMIHAMLAATAGYARIHRPAGVSDDVLAAYLGEQLSEYVTAVSEVGL